MGEQPRSAVVVVSWIVLHGALEIGNRSSAVVERQRTHASAVESIDRIGPGGDRFIVALASAGVFLLLQQQVRELFIIPGGGIVKDDRLELLNSRTLMEPFENVPEHSRIRQHFGHDVCGRTEKPAYEDDPIPIVIRAPSDRVYQRHNLEQKSPRVKEVTQSREHSGKVNCRNDYSQSLVRSADDASTLPPLGVRRPLGLPLESNHMWRTILSFTYGSSYLAGVHCLRSHF